MSHDSVPSAIEDFGDVFEPSEAAEPILSRPVRSALLEWLTEIFADDELKAVGIKARKRSLFDGPPGVGKTTLAHHLSARLGLRMVAVRPERLIAKWLGSTGRNIGALFDAASASDPQIVLFIDEFDAIGLKRTEAEQSCDSERNAWVNTLLQRIEQYDGFLIAATNHAKHIDPAIWRRFEMHISLELPGQFERRHILARYLAPFGLPGTALGALAEACETASPALMRQFCEGLKRQMIIGPKCGWSMVRESVIERLITTIHPHPDLGKPRLWSHGAKDAAIKLLPWPLPQAAEVAEPPPGRPSVDNVVKFASA
ncbi:MAG TPA: ATP-binding protein [Micropepsaceae bacterium]|nr:ATP-binding protein [Micropepsaceae bacterium]